MERFGLSPVRDRPAGTFSHVMQRRLSVLLDVLTVREVLVLDEPFDGVDPTGVDVTVAAIREAARAGMAVVVSTHLQHLLTSASDDIAVLLKGCLAAEGSASDFSGGSGGAALHRPAPVRTCRGRCVRKLTAEIRSGLAATIQLARLQGRTRSSQGRLRVRIATVRAGCVLMDAAWLGTWKLLLRQVVLVVGAV